MNKRRINKKCKKQKKQKKQFIPPIYTPTFLGARLSKHNYNQLWDWNTLENIKT